MVVGEATGGRFGADMGRALTDGLPSPTTSLEVCD